MNTRSILSLFLLMALGCQDGNEVPPTELSATPGIFEAPPTFVASAPVQPQFSPLPSPAPAKLPRSVLGTDLSATRADVERILGTLRCHLNPGGFDVCQEVTERTGNVRKIEVFFYKEKVLSLAHEVPPPSDVFGYMDRLIREYGPPSLKELAQKDKQGRLHEIYGWRDDTTLLSVRFVWKAKSEEPAVPAPDQLETISVTLWDRAAYDDWEKDAATRTPQVPPSEA